MGSTREVSGARGALVYARSIWCSIDLTFQSLSTVFFCARGSSDRAPELEQSFFIVGRRAPVRANHCGLPKGENLMASPTEALQELHRDRNHEISHVSARLSLSS